MQKSIRECYGFRVECSAHPEAAAVLDRFFGPPVPDEFEGFARTVRLTFDVVDGRGAESSAPPHTEEVIAADPITVDTGNSRAVIHPDTWSAQIDLARGDLDDQIVWGRWILERLFLYLVCRSPRHYPLHAGAVGIDGRVVLTSAPTGTGKSTLSFWALHRGATLFGEDIMVRHLDDPADRVYGLPRVVYLDADTIANCPELAVADKAAIDGGAKSRVELPASMTPRVRSEAVLDAVAFLIRDGESGVRAVEVDEAADRSRDDVMTGKPDAEARAAVEADLRALFSRLPMREVHLTGTLDDCYDALRAAVAVPVS